MKRSTVPIDSIKPHPKNYRGHPGVQVDAIRHSLDQFGQYRPVVVSSDGVILAGHGVWLARKAQGEKTIDEVRMDFPADDPRAEKLMVADNELARGAEDDQAQLAALLADIQRTDGLDGTGWDEADLAAMLGDIVEAEFGGVDQAQTLKDMAAKWLVTLVVDEATKRRVDDLIDAQALPGEHPSATVGRIFTAQVVNKS